jgi:hypothetical protein
VPGPGPVSSDSMLAVAPEGGPIEDEYGSFGEPTDPRHGHAPPEAGPPGAP